MEANGKSTQREERGGIYNVSRKANVDRVKEKKKGDEMRENVEKV